MHYLVYKITNTYNDKIYVGAHQTENDSDTYMGSGYRLKKAISKYGSSAFTREIIGRYASLDEMFEAERAIVNEDFVARTDTYNIALGGRSGGFHGLTHTEDARKRIGTASRSRSHSKSSKALISKASSSRVYSDETKRKMSESAKKRFSSSAEREKLRNANLGKARHSISDETKEKISNSLKRRYDRAATVSVC